MYKRQAESFLEQCGARKAARSADNTRGRSKAAKPAARTGSRASGGKASNNSRTAARKRSAPARRSSKKKRTGNRTILTLLLVVLVVFSFGRQMAREKREHLIRALSHAVTSGVAALAVAGWCFLPDLGAMLAKGTVAGTVALIILIVLGLALAVASTLWVRDADPDPDIRYPWIGTGLMPVMLMGVTIAATALVLGRIIG